MIIDEYKVFIMFSVTMMISVSERLEPFGAMQMPRDDRRPRLSRPGCCTCRTVRREDVHTSDSELVQPRPRQSRAHLRLPVYGMYLLTSKR